MVLFNQHISHKPTRQGYQPNLPGLQITSILKFVSQNIQNFLGLFQCWDIKQMKGFQHLSMNTGCESYTRINEPKIIKKN